MAERLVEEAVMAFRIVAKKLVEVAEVEVEFPVMFRLPLIVEEAVEMKPARVESPPMFNVPVVMILAV